MLGVKIYQTGVRNGEYIVGTGKQNMGTILKVDGFYPPSTVAMRDLSVTIVRDKLRTINFFKNMQPHERLEWLKKNATFDKDMYLGEAPDPISVQVINLGGKYAIEHLSEIDMERMYTIKEVEALIPRKPGSRAKRHTLFFRPSIWEIYQEEERKDSYIGLYVTLGRSTKVNDGEAEIKDDLVITMLDGGEMAIMSVHRPKKYTWNEIYELVPGEHLDDMKIAKDELKRFKLSPAFYKSLLQKLIRSRDKYCDFYGVKVSAEGALLATLATLFLHIGSLVPTIQRFVSGKESAFKRLAISVCEDSYTKDHSILLAMFASAALAQREKNWNPERVIVKQMFQLALDALETHKRFEWKTKHNLQIEYIGPLESSYDILKEIKSFKSDIEMVKYIACKNGKADPEIKIDKKGESFQVYRAIDHHTNPELAYFFEFPKWDIQYPELFKEIWQKSSSHNGRIKPLKNDDDYLDILFAQEMLGLTKYPVENKFIRELVKSKNGEAEIFEYVLDESWLAGLVGPIQVKNAFVVMRTDDLRSFTVIKKPSRESKSSVLTEEEKETAILNAKEILRDGVKFVNCPEILKVFKGLYVRIDDNDDYIVEFEDGLDVYWEDCLKMSTTIQYHEKVERDFEQAMFEAITITGEGIELCAEEELDRLLDEMDPSVMRRLSTTLAGMATKITLGKIGRDGTGVDYAVNVYDSAIFQFLCHICNLYPIALELEKLSFRIKNGPIYWFIRDKISAKISSGSSFAKISWSCEPDERTPWEHQSNSVETMMERTKNGKKGNLIWMKMGLGKSLIVTQYIRQLIKSGKMPKYCVWTLPSSAIKSIEREIELSGMKSKVLDCRKGKDQVLVEGIVNIVKHDHLILNGFDKAIIDIADQCLFVVDEFHKAMAKTKRSSIILDIAKLSYDVVGLSGTIVKDSNVDELIRWLQLIVEFEVTEKNYWVAVGALISRKVETKVVVNRKFVQGEMKKNYYNVVPKALGGTSNEINFKKALDMSYDVITKLMIDETVKYLKQGEKVFVAARNIANQNKIAQILGGRGYSCFKITEKDTIVLAPGDKTDHDVIIATNTHSHGYTLSLLRVGISGCWFSNQCTRDQLEGRLDRLNQESDWIDWVIVHAGILSYTLERYEKVRSLSQTLKGFAREVNVPVAELRRLI
jgi:hypothetical protein